MNRKSGTTSFIIRRRIVGVYALVVAASFFISVAALTTARSLLGRETRFVSNESAALQVTSALSSNVELMSASMRGYLLTGEPRLLERLQAARVRFDESIAALRGDVVETNESELLDEIVAAESSYNAIIATLTTSPAEPLRSQAVTTLFKQSLEPASERLAKSVNAFRALQHERLDVATKVYAATATRSLRVVGAASCLVIVAAISLSIVLLRLLHSLTEREEQLEKANRDLDAFAGRIAHDLKNALAPLVLVSGLNDMSKRQLSSILKRRLDIAFSLVDGLLAFSRAARPDVRGASIVRGVLDDVVSEFENVAEELHAVVKSECEDITVACAPPLLHMVLANLVSNALKFLVESPERRVDIRARTIAGECELVVEDSGPGIPAAEIPRVFEPFYRGAATAAPGTGIGLATVERIVAAHGGRIVVESEVRSGTRFRVFLPLALETFHTSLVHH